MDKIINALASLGVPGLILGVSLSTAGAGLKGAAALTTALKAIGPKGMKTGIAILLGTTYAVSEFSDVGIEKITMSITNKIMKEENLTKEEMIEKVRNYKVSKGLKYKIIAQLEAM